MTLTLVPLGTGDAFSADHPSCANALVFQSAGARSVLLIDCPHPIRKMLRDAARMGAPALDLDDVTACVLTHLHADHASGVETFLWYSRFALQRLGVLALHADVKRRLWDGLLAAGMEQLRDADGATHKLALADVASCVELADDTQTQIGPFSIEVRRTIHHIPTFALRIRAGDASVAFSADTAWDDGLLAWLLEADLVIHEAGHGPAHTPLERLAVLAPDVRARMRLTHLGDDVDRAALPIAALEEGRTLVVDEFRAHRALG